MRLRVYLSVKFRFAFITFGTLTKEWLRPVPAAIEVPGLPIDFNERGVTLRVELIGLS